MKILVQQAKFKNYTDFGFVSCLRIFIIGKSLSDCY